MEEQKSVKLELSVADLKRSINELRDEIVRAKSENRDYSKTVSELRGKQAELDEVMKLGKEDVKAYNAEMRAAQKELKGYESQMLNVEKYSDKWYELAKAAGALKDNIQDAKDATKAFASDTRGLDNIVGIGKSAVAAFGTWQGIMGMIGVENEKVVETIQKLQAATTTLTMVQKLQNALMNKSVGIGLLWNKTLTAMGLAQKSTAKATAGATAATKTFGKALAGIGIGIVVAALAALIANWNKLTSALGGASKAQKEYNKTLDEAKKKGMEVYSQTLAELYTNYKKLQAEWKTLSNEQQKTEWIKKNQTNFQDLGEEIKNVLDAEKIFSANDSKVLESLKKRAMGAAAAAEAMEIYQQAVKIDQEKAELDLYWGKKVSEAKGREGTYNARTGQAVGGYSADDQRKSFIAEWMRQSDELDEKQDALNKKADALMEKAFQLGQGIANSWSGATSSVTKYTDTVEKAASLDLSEAQDLRDSAKFEAQKKYLNGLLTETEYKKELLNIDKQYEADLGNLADRYKDNAKLQIKFSAEADKVCRENEIKSLELAAETKEKIYKAANDAIKKDNEATLEEIELETKQKQLAAYEAFNERTAGMDQNSREYQEAERDLQKKLGQIDAEERARQIEAIQTYWDKLIALAVENGEETVELERKRQLALTNVFLEGQQQRTKAEKANNKKWKKWSEQTAEERVKTVKYWANSSAELLGYVGEIIEANIQRKVDEGKIDQEEAEKQFERTKALQYSIVWINTLTGMMGAWEKWFDPQTRTDGWTALAMAIATSTAIFAQGVAQSMQIKNMKFGGGGDSGGATGGAGGTVAVQDVQVAPLLNQRQDSQDMTALNTAQLIEQNTEQRVYILQSDLEKSSSQVEARVSQTSF